MTNFETRIRKILDELGVPGDFQQNCKMPLQVEAIDLVRAEDDMFGREQYMTAVTEACWREMKEAALGDGIELQLVSAFRSVDYQCNLIRSKLQRGEVIEEILRVNAAPGYSEHHTGRALDLNTPGCEPLSEAFESTDAYRWLTEHAGRFSFHESYPRDNPFGIIYEPWHWANRRR